MEMLNRYHLILFVKREEEGGRATPLIQGTREEHQRLTRPADDLPPLNGRAEQQTGYSQRAAWPEAHKPQASSQRGLGNNIYLEQTRVFQAGGNCSEYY
jgi:hypothetical protein